MPGVQQEENCDCSQGPLLFHLLNSPCLAIESVFRSSRRGSAVTNPGSIHEDVGLIPGPAQGVKDLALQ